MWRGTWHVWCQRFLSPSREQKYPLSIRGQEKWKSEVKEWRFVCKSKHAKCVERKIFSRFQPKITNMKNSRSPLVVPCDCGRSLESGNTWAIDILDRSPMAVVGAERQYFPGWDHLEVDWFGVQPQTALSVTGVCLFSLTAAGTACTEGTFLCGDPTKPQS